MELFEAKVTREADNTEETTCVSVTFKQGRVSGLLNFMVMARPENIRYQGKVTINGIEYRASMSLECNKVEIRDYALTRVDTFSTHPSDSALKSFHTVLVELVERVRLIPAFQAQQKLTAIWYLGYDIKRNEDTITRLNDEIDSLAKDIDIMREQIQDFQHDPIVVNGKLAVYPL